ncbi:MAG: hypothetical protein Q8K32_04645 [Archangium sp.]|nr:hypothetical protein [Archangium sp.]
MSWPARSRAVSWSLWLLLGACAPVKKSVVRPQPFDFGGVRAHQRAFAGEAICEAEPRFLLDELSSVNGLLKTFLKAVPEGSAAAWAEGAVSLLDEGATRLPPLLQVHAEGLAALKGCAFAATGAWPALIDRGQALIDQTRRRLVSAPEALRVLQAARALEAWRKERLTQQEAARRACPRKPGPSPRVYFAWREGPLTTWLFCDGAQVTREGQRPPQLEAAPEEFTRGRRPAAGAYLGATGRFSGAAIMSAPGEEALSAW